LQLRGIQLPDELKDEVFLIVGERRMGGTSTNH
jgi:NaMN:DMB phosphoribosyltransferase